MENKKTITIIIAIITVLLALVAVYTGIKLWQLSRKPAEEIKKEKPAIMEVIPVPCEENSTCQISFTLKPRTSGTPSPTPTTTGTPGPSETPTPGPSSTPTPGPSATPTPGPGPTNTPVPGATNTPFPGATETPGPGPTNTPPPDCFDSCTTTDECSSSLTCIDNRCVNAECPDQTNCVCPAPEIPVVGISSPTLILGIGGLLLLMIGLLL